MNSHLRPYNRCISNISTNIYLGLDFLVKKGKKVLLIDFDPQGNLVSVK